MVWVENAGKATLEKRLQCNSRQELTRNTCVMDAAILEDQTELTQLPIYDSTSTIYIFSDFLIYTKFFILIDFNFNQSD